MQAVYIRTGAKGNLVKLGQFCLGCWTLTPEPDYTKQAVRDRFPVDPLAHR